MIVGALVLLAWIPLRQRPGVGTISNVIVVGSVIDLVMAFVPPPHGLTSCAVVIMLLGVALNGVATGAYIGARLGPGPRDGLMTGFAARGHSIRVVRTAIELSVLVVGYLLGGTVGVGTLVYALAIGPLAHVFIPLLSLEARAAGGRGARARRPGGRELVRSCTPPGLAARAGSDHGVARASGSGRARGARSRPEVLSSSKRSRRSSHSSPVRGQPVAGLAAGALRLDEAGAAQRREVLRHRLPAHRQLAGHLGRGRRAVVGEVAEQVAAARVGERGEDAVERIAHPAQAQRERRGLQVERRRPGGRRLDDGEPGAVGVVGQRELDLALVLPGEGQALARLDAGDGGPALLAVVPAEAGPAAGAELELDVVREPVGEPLGVGERLARPPRAARGGRSPCGSCATSKLRYSEQPQGCTLQEVDDARGSGHPDGRRAGRARRARVRHLLAPAARAHRLPGPGGRRHDRQPRSPPSCSSSRRRIPTRTSGCTSTRPEARLTPGMAIYDAMQYVKPDVATVCLGMGMSAAAMILCGGAAGKRFALPNAKLMIHQGSGGFRGTPADIQIAAREILATTRQMAEIISRHTGQPVEQVLRDIDRDRFMTPRGGDRVRAGRRDASPTGARRSSRRPEPAGRAAQAAAARGSGDRGSAVALADPQRRAPRRAGRARRR